MLLQNEELLIFMERPRLQNVNSHLTTEQDSWTISDAVYPNENRNGVEYREYNASLVATKEAIKFMISHSLSELSYLSSFKIKMPMKLNTLVNFLLIEKILSYQLQELKE